MLTVLVLPKPWGFEPLNTLSTLIEIELKASPTEPVVPISPEVKTEAEPIAESKPENKPKNRTTTVKHPPQRSINKPLISSTGSTQSESSKQTKNIINSGDILLSAKNRTSIHISTEFQARAVSPKDFYIPSPEIENWLDDIPFLDESVDRPTIQMKFYAEGIEGSVEKFFDKITVSKTFTTKYGTKIHCALIGVIAACGWK